MTTRACLTTTLLAAGTLGLAACAFNDILGVHVPGRVQADALDDAALANTLAASVVSDLECSWNNYVAGSALIGDEFIQASGNLNQRNWASRRITADEPTMAQGSCRTAYGIYTTLQTARFQAEDIFKRIDGFPDAKVPNKTLLKAQVRAYGAFALVALGEGFCQMALDGGPLMAPKDVLGLAETRFTDAITLATSANSSDILNMVLVGRARVRLDLGNFAGAIADAQRVPVGYLKVATRDASDVRRYDALCENITCPQNRNATVAPNYRNVTWQGVPDPRVAVATTGQLAFDNAQIHYFPTKKHTARDYGLLLASYKEARLFIAEASARSRDRGQEQQRGALHEGGREHRGDQGRGAAPGETAQERPNGQPEHQADQGVECGVWVHTARDEGGHRLNDHLRFRGTVWAIPFKGEPGSIFPSGVDATGLPYGSTTCFPLPTVEIIGNPNIAKP